MVLYRPCWFSLAGSVTDARRKGLSSHFPFDNLIKFYVEGQDPKVADFYASICASLALDFAEFRAVFDSPEALQVVQQEFIRCRQWGVRSFPILLLERNGKTEPLAEGFVTAEQVLSRLQQEITA